MMNIGTNELPLGTLQLLYDLSFGITIALIALYVPVQLMEKISGLPRQITGVLWLLGGGSIIGITIWLKQWLSCQGDTYLLTNSITAMLMLMLVIVVAFRKQKINTGTLVEDTDKGSTSSWSKLYLALMAVIEPQTFKSHGKIVSKQVTSAAEALEEGQVSVWLYDRKHSQLERFDYSQPSLRRFRYQESSQELELPIQGEFIKYPSPGNAQKSLSVAPQMVSVIASTQPTALVSLPRQDQQNSTCNSTDLVTNTQESYQCKYSSKTLVTSEACWEFWSQNSTELIAKHTPEGIYLYASPACSTIVGYTPQELVGNSVYEFFHPQDLANFGQCYSKIFKDPEINSLTYRFRHQNGNYIWLETTITPIRDPETGILREIFTISRDITEHRQTQQALEESQHQLQKLTANVPGMIYQLLRRTDGSLSFTFVSDGAREIYELEPSLIEQNAALIIDQIHPDDRASFEESMAICARNLEVWRWEGRIITVSGKLKWLQANSRPELQANGDLLWHGMFIESTQNPRSEAATHGIGVLEEITDFKQIEAPLWKRSRLSSLAAVVEDQLMSVRALLGNRGLNLPSSGTLSWIANAIAVAVDRYWADSEILSRRESLLLGLANQIRNSLELDTILETAVESIYSLLLTDRCQFLWCKKRDGIISWEVVKEVKNSALPSQLGKYTTEQVRPITERLLNRQIIRVDEVEKLNDTQLRQFLVEMGYTSVLSIPIDTHSGEIGVISCSQSKGVRSWDDSEVDLLRVVVAQLAIAIDQAELYTQARQSALVAQKQAQELELALNQLKTAQAKLVQSAKMSSLGQLIAGIAHAINNPVSFIHGNLTYASAYIFEIMGLLNLYQEHYPNPPAVISEQAELIDIDFISEDMPKLVSSMHVGTERIRSIVLSLRKFSRLDEAEMKRVDLHEGIDSTLLILEHRLKPKSSHREIKILKEYGDLTKVECYPGQLNQVFFNILNNAVEAFERSALEGKEITSPVISIRTSIVGTPNSIQNSGSELKKHQLEPEANRRVLPKLNSQRVVIQITDNGPGMTESVKAQIFDPFFTTKPSGQGTGFGLAISYQIITENHHGTLNCTSVPGQGSEFRIEIPIEQTGISCPLEY
ncbi:MAG: PAS domain-containing protein [Symploca sp. SIO2B6]|nr:PAS domain-containing protein [Symploca sp. SIO2B6]